MDPLLDHAPCGFFSVDDDGRLLQSNATLATMLRMEPGKLAGLHVDALLTNASRIFYQTHVFPMMKLEGRVSEIHLSMLRADRSEIPVIFNAVRRSDSAPARSDCVAVEMRQRSEYESALVLARRNAEDASRAKDDFLAHVSHELRTPLTSIAGWAHMLAGGQLVGEARDRAIEAIVRNTRAQTKLIDDMLDFARITAGKLRLELAPLDLGAAVQGALDAIEPAAAARHITLERNFEDDLPPILGDADRLQQVLSNITSNAVKFTPKGGRITVSIAPVNSSLEVAVSDTGRGIAPEFLPFVFERFRQADDGARRAGGLGLGMSITRHLVELHGGTVRAESAGEGKGSTFIVRLPVTARVRGPRRTALSGSEVPAAMPTAPDLGHLHVLVVDDDLETRHLLNALLTGRGARVSAAANSKEAIRFFKESRPDLLVSDIDLGEAEDGYTLLKRLKEMGGDTRLPAIALTARARPADRLGAIAAGFQVHLPKPVDPAELVMTISNLA